MALLCLVSGCGDDGPVVGGTESDADTGSSTAGADDTGSSSSNASIDDSTGTSTSNGGSSSSDSSESGGSSETTGGGARCGNTIAEEGEDCDEGEATARCDDDCTAVACGDGTINRPAGEQCEAADRIDGDGCDADCTLSVVSSVVTGGEHTCALLDTGTVRCWGQGEWGQLGAATTDDLGDDEDPAAGSPIDLGGVATAVVAGYRHACALLDDGAVRCWGDGTYGQIGQGNTDAVGDDELPSAVEPVDVGGVVTQLVSGYFHVCALLDEGTLRCWGAGEFGQLGLGNIDNVGDDEVPGEVAPVALAGTVVEIAGGFLHTCVRLEAGEVQCWGEGADGQLGYGNPNAIGDDELADAGGLVSIGGPAEQVTTGGHHTCARLQGGAVRCWGRGAQGQLGYGNTTNVGDDELPSTTVAVVLPEAPTTLATGFLHTCARAGANAYCWGFAGLGELGTGTTANLGDDEPIAGLAAIDLGLEAAQLATANDHACVLDETGRLRCWGLGLEGRLGYATVETVGDDETPSEAGDVPVF
jgi:cysteine-rich repeat protein